CVTRVSRGEVTAARQSRMKPSGNRNQPDRPRSVIRSKTSSNHCGKVRAQALAAVSIRNMQATEAISMTMTATTALADGGGTLARGARTRTLIHCRKFLSTFCHGADEDKTLPPFTVRLRQRRPRC